MKLSTIPNVYRNVNRAREIVTVLSKYGLADWISRFNLDFAKNIFKDPAGEALARHTREARIRMALSELGPTFIKLGQLLSTRPDLVGATLAGELEKLQTSAPADPAAEVHQTILEDLGQSVERIFRHFTDEPIASASIGQVHAATLKTGEQVVVKVQHTGIAKTIRKDIDVMGGLAQLAERIPEFAAYRPAATLAEFQRTLLRELDFGREERNLQQFAARFADDPSVHIPQPITELCTPRVLTMERIEGIKVTDVTDEINSGLDPEKLAHSGANLYLEMIFVDGHYHADPHPGNLLIQPGNVIGLLDFGMVGRIEETLREDIEEMMFALVQTDSIHLASIISRLGKVPPGLDKTSFRADLEDFVSHYVGQSLGHFDMAAALTEMADMIFRYKIVLPPQVSMLLKTLITLEGTAKLLHPSFSILEVMRPFQRRALFRRLSPKRRIRKIRRAYMEMEHLMAVFPRRMMEILDQVQSGTFDVHLDHRGLGPSVNRLVLGMLTSALFLGSSLMLSRQVPPVLFQTPTFMGLHNLSILGLGGCIVSLLIGLRLLRAIVKSGHLDSRE
jgi:ubiquinone biosynthesis protein